MAFQKIGAGYLWFGDLSISLKEIHDAYHDIKDDSKNTQESGYFKVYSLVTNVTSMVSRVCEIGYHTIAAPKEGLGCLGILSLAADVNRIIYKHRKNGVELPNTNHSVHLAAKLVRTISQSVLVKVSIPKSVYPILYTAWLTGLYFEGREEKSLEAIKKSR